MFKKSVVIINIVIFRFPSEYNHFDRPELLVTCCDYVCTISLSPEETGIALPPPGDMLRARRPSFWDLPDDVFKGRVVPPTIPTRVSI